jgi:ABC-type uncharacterized transport system permease subunit
MAASITTIDRQAVPAWIQATPFALVFLIFFVLPLVFVAIVSFWDYNDFEMLPTFTTRSYTESFEGCLTSLPDLCTILKTYVSTAKFCFIVWLATLIIGFTIAYFLAFYIRSVTTQMVLFLVCTIPFWTSNVIRMISWIPLLGRNGLVNQTLIDAHVIDKPLEWLLYSQFSVALAFVHLFTFFMVVPHRPFPHRSGLRFRRQCGANIVESHHPALQARHCHRLYLCRDDRHGRFHHVRRDGRPADRLRGKGGGDAAERAAIPARRG